MNDMTGHDASLGYFSRSRGTFGGRLTGSGLGNGALILSDIAAVASGLAIGVLLCGLISPALCAGFSLAPGAAAAGGQIALLTAVAVGVFLFGGLYSRPSWPLDEVGEIRQVARGILLVAGIDLALSLDPAQLAAGGMHAGHLTPILTWTFVGFLAVGGRMAVRALASANGRAKANVVLVGSELSSARFLDMFGQDNAKSIRLLRILPVRSLVSIPSELLRLRLAAIASASGLKPSQLKLVLAPDVDEMDAICRFAERLEEIGQPFSVLGDGPHLRGSCIGVSQPLGADAVLIDTVPRGEVRLNHMAKRTFDIIAGSLILAVILPLVAGIAALLRLEGGPVLFVQKRVGRNGRRFDCLKFRTMLPDAEARLARLLEKDPVARRNWELYQKLDNDPRITPVGNFLRRTSLDELPQLLNVIRGDMSLVGPRPIVAPEVPNYSSDRAYFESAEFRYYSRLMPGITGLWQVSGRTETTHRERVRLDSWYARNWSFWLDVAILLKTLKVVVCRTGR